MEDFCGSRKARVIECGQAVGQGQPRLKQQRELVVLLPGTAVRGPPVSVIYPQAGQGLAKVRVFTDFTIQLLRQWQRRVAAVTGLMDPP